MKTESFASQSFSRARIICRPGQVGIPRRLLRAPPILRRSDSPLSIIRQALIFLPLPQFLSFRPSGLKSISRYLRNPVFAWPAQSLGTVQANLPIFRFSIPLESCLRLVIDLIERPETFAFLVLLRAFIRFSPTRLPLARKSAKGVL